MIQATIRMKRGAEQWAKSRQIHEAILAKRESMKMALESTKRKSTSKSPRKSIMSGR